MLAICLLLRHVISKAVCLVSAVFPPFPQQPLLYYMAWVTAPLLPFWLIGAKSKQFFFVFIFGKWAKIIEKKKDNEKHLPHGGKGDCSSNTVVCSSLSLIEKAAAVVNSQGGLQSLIRLDLAASDSNLQVLSLHLHFSNTHNASEVFLYCVECSGTTREAGERLWVNAPMAAGDQLAFRVAELCHHPCSRSPWAVSSREFGVIGNWSSETHQAASSLLFHIKLNIFAVVRGACCVSPISCSPHTSVGWCLAAQMPSSRKQHGKVCGANRIYWFIFHFTDVWDWWLFPQTVCTQSHWSGTVSRVKGSWRIHNCLTGIHAPLVGTRGKKHASKVWWGVCSRCLCVSFCCCWCCRLHAGDCSLPMPQSYKTGLAFESAVAENLSVLCLLLKPVIWNVGCLRWGCAARDHLY